MLANFAAFAIASALLAILPGPDTLIAIRSLIRGGRRLAVRTIAGTLSGLALWSLIAALGLAAALRASEGLYLALRVVGAIYLITFGIQSFRRRKVKTFKDEVNEAPKKFFEGGYLAGLLTNLLNPKVGVFFVTFLPGFIPEDQPVFATTLLLGLVFELVSAAYYVALLFLASVIVRWMSTDKVRSRLDKLTGGVLVALGLRLGLES